MILYLFCGSLFAQDINVHSTIQHNFLLTKDTIITGPNLIDPKSIVITSKHDSLIHFDVSKNKLHINFSATNKISSINLNVRFRVFAMDLLQKHCLIGSTEYKFFDKAIAVQQLNEQNSRFKQDQNSLNYNGNFTRGFAFGNSQDLVLNSALDLTLEGELDNGLKIRAAISDANLPIQAEGNTQQLKEFDQVFIEMSKNNTSVLAGDYILQKEDQYFPHYLKKLKGVSVHQQFIKDKDKSQVKASYAISRGKFTRQILNTTESNQGPYKLTGQNNNPFVIILSGTEKVYADGILLKRGFNYEYTIDYNSAEIVFTANFPITKDTRIIIDYEYTDQQFLRSLYGLDAQWKKKNWTLGLDVYSEQDSKNILGDSDLDTIDINLLQNIGDDIQLASRSGFFIPDSLNNSFVPYSILFDTINNIEYLQYNPNEPNPISSRFSRVETGEGRYIINDQLGVNQRVYEYVGPGNGNYDAVIPLVPPEQKQLYTFSLKNNKIGIYSELSLSNLDINRFSENGNQDNQGFAWHGAFEKSFDISKNWTSTYFINTELTNKNYVALNPYRAVEFIRNWNTVKVDQLKSNEILISTGTSFKHTKNLIIDYTLDSYIKKDLYQGLRHETEIKWSNDFWRIQLGSSLLNSEDDFDNITFLKPKGKIERSLFKNKLKLGVSFLKEMNESSSLAKPDSLSFSSFDFNETLVYSSFEANQNTKVKFVFKNRTDFLPLNGLFEKNSIAKEAGLELLHKKKNSNLDLVLKYRNLNIVTPILDNQRSTESIISRLQHRWNLLNSGIKIQSEFETSSGQEPKLEFRYLEVQQGEGQFVWIDYNQDSIQQVSEFEISPFSDQGNYQKFSVFNDEFIRTTNQSISELINISSQKFIPKKSSFSFLRILDWRTRYSLSQKRFQDQTDSNIFPFSLSLNDDELVSYLQNIEHTLFINRTNPFFDIQLRSRKTLQKTNQIGAGQKIILGLLEGIIRARTNVNFDFSLTIAKNEKMLDEFQFQEKNYDINSYSISPELSYRPNQKFRLKASYTYNYKKDRLDLDDLNSRSHTMGIDLDWRKENNSILQTNFDVVNILYDGDLSTASSFEILNGLKPGLNYVWTINYTRKLAKNLDLSFRYNGRKSELSRTVHIMSAQIRANF